MVRVNENYLKIQSSYLFTEIAHRVKAFSEKNPSAKIIRLGIGDVTEPLPPAVIEAMHKAVDDIAKRETFYGYGPEQGYGFLREARRNVSEIVEGVTASHNPSYNPKGLEMCWQ